MIIKNNEGRGQIQHKNKGTAT